ncbi:MAG: cytochrome c [Bdellovibrionales bacterium]|jgi:mono/diheme cytochrome c family protein|nr:cytochrome c [Bdellovibrionales bacterium]MBT3525396.1 cytochrome c [Bdellovibrionales bacterium]MBT7668632.1 cytochrome c [Bdellovibrionales bacterium]
MHNSEYFLKGRVGIFILAFIVMVPLTHLHAFNAEAEFKTKCAACHTIGGGDRVGPDLSGVVGKRDRAWLLSFIKNPMGMITGGDKVAAELFKKYNNIPMPTLGLTDSQTESLLNYIGTKSTSAASASTTSAAAATVDQSTGDASLGRALFAGTTGLKNGGPQCLSCHQAGGAGGIVGGALGPDLTKVFSRYGVAGLKGVLGSIAFPTMAGPYKGKELTSEEVSGLVAFFKEMNQSDHSAMSIISFVIYGIVGLVIALFFINLLWASRRVETKRPLR